MTNILVHTYRKKKKNLTSDRNQLNSVHFSKHCYQSGISCKRHMFHLLYPSNADESFTDIQRQKTTKFQYMDEIFHE